MITLTVGGIALMANLNNTKIADRRLWVCFCYALNKMQQLYRFILSPLEQARYIT